MINIMNALSTLIFNHQRYFMEITFLAFTKDVKTSWKYLFHTLIQVDILYYVYYLIQSIYAIYSPNISQ